MRASAAILLSSTLILPASALLGSTPDSARAEASSLDGAIDSASADVAPRVITWRRDFHEHPELSNREFRTAQIVADHLESLGLRVRREVAHTGVVAVLEGGHPGPVVALRADMDALPVTEATGLPFASQVRTTYLEREVGIMHACGHDAHTAILFGVAEVLAGLRERLQGSVVFLFQPAEEGAPPGERGGARLMIEEGALLDPSPQAVFGLHVVPQYQAGEIAALSGGAMAGSDRLEISVRGRQTHAAYPWLGVDPIAVASRIVLALQALPGRQLDVRHPSVVSIGAIHGGVRHNIIPDEVELLGTIRVLEPSMQEDLHQRIRTTATSIAASAGASAEVDIHVGYPVTYNDPELTGWARPVLARVAGPGKLVPGLPRTGAEDFSFLAHELPGLYFWLGIRKPGLPEAEAAPNHSPEFLVDESALVLGVRALASLAADYLAENAGP
jgi:amidohydrolase